MYVYICGAITGLPEEECRARFQAVEDWLTSQGHQPINPWKVEPPRCDMGKFSYGLNRTPEEAMWLAYIVNGMTIVANRLCDAIYLMDNWHSSDGAICEAMVAKHYGLQFMLEEDDTVYGDWFDLQMKKGGCE